MSTSPNQCFYFALQNCYITMPEQTICNKQAYKYYVTLHVINMCNINYNNESPRWCSKCPPAILTLLGDDATDEWLPQLRRDPAWPTPFSVALQFVQISDVCFVHLL